MSVWLFTFRIPPVLPLELAISTAEISIKLSALLLLKKKQPNEIMISLFLLCTLIMVKVEVLTKHALSHRPFSV